MMTPCETYPGPASFLDIFPCLGHCDVEALSIQYFFTDLLYLSLVSLVLTVTILLSSTSGLTSLSLLLSSTCGLTSLSLSLQRPAFPHASACLNVGLDHSPDFRGVLKHNLILVNLSLSTGNYRHHSGDPAVCPGFLILLLNWSGLYVEWRQ